MSTYNKTIWQDGDIITADKMNNIENGIYSYNEEITNLSTATSSDIGKALSPKTVSNGKVTEWQYKSVSGGGGGGGTSDYSDLDNKPSIGGVTLAGSMALSDIGAASASDLTQLGSAVSEISTSLATKAAASDLTAETTRATNAEALKIDKPSTDGTAGQVLQTDGNGGTSWGDVTGPSDAQVSEAVSDWLDEHPEATTTVADGSITKAKLAPDALEDVEDALSGKADAIISSTDEGYTHTGLDNPVKIIFNGNDLAFKTARYADHENVLPIKVSTTTLPNGVTVECNGHFIRLNGTAAANRSTYILENVPVSIPAGTYKTYFQVDPGDTVFANDNLNILVRGKYANASTINFANAYIRDTDREYSCTLTNDVTSISILLGTTNATVYDNYTIWFGAYPEGTAFTDTLETVAAESIYEYTDKSLSDIIDTMQHTSVVSYVADTKTYVDEHMPSDMLTEKDLVYVTPEMFGAFGDFDTDDTQAVQDCIDYAIANHVDVRGSGRYKTTNTISIIGDELNLYLNVLRNFDSNQSVGLKVIGKFNRIHMNTLASKGDSLVLTTDTSHDCSSNYFDIGRCTSEYGTNVVLTKDDTTKAQFLNEFHHKFLYAPNGHCIYIDEKGVPTNETYVIGNGLKMRSGDWAIYIKNGKAFFSGLDMESTVQKGFYLGSIGAVAIVENSRTTEMLDMIDSDQTDPEKGLLVKGPGAQNLRLINTTADYRSIDVSECMSAQYRIDTYGTQAGSSGDLRNVTINKNLISRYCDALAYDEEDNSVQYSSQCYVPKGTELLVWFDKKYIIAPNDIIIDFGTDTTISNSGVYIAGTSTKILPTVIRITASCTIHLSESYNPIATSKIIVMQNTAGATAQIYDSNGTLVFDGATLGTGSYELRCIVDPSQIPNSIKNLYHLFLGTNMIWLVSKL